MFSKKEEYLTEKMFKIKNKKKRFWRLLPIGATTREQPQLKQNNKIFWNMIEGDTDKSKEVKQMQI